LKKITVEAWIKDALKVPKHLTKRNKVAFVSYIGVIRNFRNFVYHLLSEKGKGFEYNTMLKGID
jgi:hypothetical protein